jgi:hypothetical protein
LRYGVCTRKCEEAIIAKMHLMLDRKIIAITNDADSRRARYRLKLSAHSRQESHRLWCEYVGVLEEARVETKDHIVAFGLLTHSLKLEPYSRYGSRASRL